MSTLPSDETRPNEVVAVARKPAAAVGLVAWAAVIGGVVLVAAGNVIWLTILGAVIMLIGVLGLAISRLLRHPERAIEKLAHRRAMLGERLHED